MWVGGCWGRRIMNSRPDKQTNPQLERCHVKRVKYIRRFFAHQYNASTLKGVVTLKEHLSYSWAKEKHTCLCLTKQKYSVTVGEAISTEHSSIRWFRRPGTLQGRSQVQMRWRRRTGEIWGTGFMVVKGRPRCMSLVHFSSYASSIETHFNFLPCNGELATELLTYVWECIIEWRYLHCNTALFLSCLMKQKSKTQIHSLLANTLGLGN